MVRFLDIFDRAAHSGNKEMLCGKILICSPLLFGSRWLFFTGNASAGDYVKRGQTSARCKFR